MNNLVVALLISTVHPQSLGANLLAQINAFDSIKAGPSTTEIISPEIGKELKNLGMKEVKAKGN